MGLDSYIFSCPRKGNVTPVNIMAMHDLFEYEKMDDKYKTEDYYPTVEKYLESQTAYTIKDLPDDKEIIQYYREFAARFNGEIVTDEMYWRNNHDIHKWFVEHFQKADDCRAGAEITREDWMQFLLYLNDSLEGEFDLGSISYAYRYNDDDSITSIPCDGVEVEKYSGGLDRVDKDFFFSVQDGEGFVSNLNSLREAIRVLARINFDTEMLFYVSSW